MQPGVFRLSLVRKSTESPGLSPEKGGLSSLFFTAKLRENYNSVTCPTTRASTFTLSLRREWSVGNVSC